MTLTHRPPTPRLPDPTVPFVVCAVWAETDAGSSPPSNRVLSGNYQPQFDTVKIAIANIPGGPLYEFALGGTLAGQVGQVHPSELPIVLSLRLDQEDGHGVWRFTYHGGPECFPEIWQVPPEVQPQPPRPLAPEELNAGAEAMVREALGIPDTEPIPDPAGELPPEDRPEEPYRFDPERHMDLSRAEAPPPLPDPAAPGPAPLPDAQTLTAPELPPPARPVGSYGDATIPFAH